MNRRSKTNDRFCVLLRPLLLYSRQKWSWIIHSMSVSSISVASIGLLYLTGSDAYLPLSLSPSTNSCYQIVHRLCILWCCPTAPPISSKNLQKLGAPPISCKNLIWFKLKDHLELVCKLSARPLLAVKKAERGWDVSSGLGGCCPSNVTVQRRQSHRVGQSQHQTTTGRGHKCK